MAVKGVEIDGHRLEGTGVVPDYLVERPLPYAHGTDPVLDAAADLLSRPEEEIIRTPLLFKTGLVIKTAASARAIAYPAFHVHRQDDR